ncbi:MAG: lipoyl(octanoyl) transferase LipB [Bacteroidales bacterium]|jgi:lipoyl(octanoyl) transferase|nr:lipoyl(octanoyl) transferase LipB [Bacteroidales bacterium]MDD3724088.1 lipoyl(octanoyl) transferase LipB [Bacteroidales bacterium]MDD4544319.1 lipoyl(octanoyl) transferase LipB [Bacteroidales bacterium]MDY0053142.1 lipoyl(octanoyl) transferase LipB [Bacteroidales bacterium]
MNYIDWGLIDYKEAWDRQEEMFERKISEKINSKKDIEQDFILCQHPHVYTLGKNGERNNLLINDEFLKKIEATYYHTNRGGDITYHGFGQIVGYPIFDIEALNLSLKSYIHTIEEMIIMTLREYSIETERLEGATGVWLDINTPRARKICAIGVKASRYITMHGFALNVNTDLKYFQYINPCGFVDKGVTSMEKELNRKVDVEEVKEKLFKNLMLLIGK